jgi:hypothetical protein
VSVRRATLLGLALALGLVAACQTGPALGPPPLEVAILGLELPEPGTGRLRLALPVPAPQVAQVSWELALDGRPFAAGLETAPLAVDGGVVVDAVLAWRHLGWREGPRWVQVVVRGVLLPPGEPVGRAFRGEREVLVPGAPLLEAPLE